MAGICASGYAQTLTKTNDTNQNQSLEALATQAYESNAKKLEENGKWKPGTKWGRLTISSVATSVQERTCEGREKAVYNQFLAIKKAVTNTVAPLVKEATNNKYEPPSGQDWDDVLEVVTLRMNDTDSGKPEPIAVTVYRELGEPGEEHHLFVANHAKAKMGCSCMGTATME